MRKRSLIVSCVIGFALALAGVTTQLVGTNEQPVQPPAFVFNTDCFLTVEGKAFSDCEAFPGLGSTACPPNGEEVDLASTPVALTATGATLSDSAGKDCTCVDGGIVLDCDDHYLEGDLDVLTKWKLGASTSSISIVVRTDGTTVFAKAVKGPGGGGPGLVDLARATWKIPNGNNTFYLRVPFSINGDVGAFHIDKARIARRTRSGTFDTETATMIWAIIEDDNPTDCSDDGEAFVVGSNSLTVIGTDTDIDTLEGEDVDVPSGVTDFILRMVYRTESRNSASAAVCGDSFTSSGSFIETATLTISPVS